MLKILVKTLISFSSFSVINSSLITSQEFNNQTKNLKSITIENELNHGSDLIWNFDYLANKNQTFYWYQEIMLDNLDHDLLNNVKNWSLLDDKGTAETWASWGNDRFTGTPAPNLGQQTLISHLDLINANGDLDTSGIYENAIFALQEVKHATDGLAWIDIWQFMGISIFLRHDIYYLSIFGRSTVLSSTTFSGGRLFINLGSKVRLEIETSTIH